LKVTGTQKGTRKWVSRRKKKEKKRKTQQPARTATYAKQLGQEKATCENLVKKVERFKKR